MDVTTTLRHHEQTTVSAKRQLYQEMTKPDRVASIDVLRGVAMIFMALNHTQISFSPQTFGDSIRFKASGCSSSLLRWIPDFCASVFVYLAGVEAYLQLTRGKTKRHLSRFQQHDLWES